MCQPESEYSLAVTIVELPSLDNINDTDKNMLLMSFLAPPPREEVV